MSRQVLLISGHQGFMVNAIINGLEKSEYEVATASLNAGNIDSMKQKPKLWIIYADEDVSDAEDALIYIKEKVTERKIPLFVIGDNDSLFELKKIIPNDIITKTFLRPIDVNDLIRSLDKADNVVFKLTDKKNILIVDDNATVLRKMKSVLETRYHCYIASSGMDAIKIITKNKIDLVLLDYEMPEVNGIQVLKMIRSDEAIADTPVMFLSGKCDKDVVVSAVALKPEKYLLKSMSSIELVKSIEQFFIDRRLEELGN